jgi:hypothetical protein
LETNPRFVRVRSGEAFIVGGFQSAAPKTQNSIN